ncbi:MAG: polysaccharide deacetylase family protein [Oscillospiraceae bacterium]|jgi:hypothetical protein|nr:polysaccharide deacetylase family protein [Oscillospiraceae bacterium]
MKKTAALIAAAVMLVALLPVRAATGEEFYFGAVNDEPLKPLSTRYMPIYMDNKVFVPHQLLTESKIGAIVEWFPQHSYLKFTHAGKSVNFEYGSSVAVDSEGKQYEAYMYRYEGLDRVRIYYLDLAFLERFYGWEKHTVIDDNEQYGEIIRVKTTKNLRTDQLYASNYRNTQMQYYLASDYAPQPSNPPASQTPNSAAPITPPPSATPPPIMDPPRGVYITFDGELNAQVTELLDILENRGGKIPAAFFLNEAGLKDDPALLRRLSATQTVGLCADGDGELTDELKRMNGILDDVTFTKTRLARHPVPPTDKNAGLSPEELAALGVEGFLLWGWTIDAGAYQEDLSGQRLAERVIRDIGASDGNIVVRLRTDTRSAEVLPFLLDAFSDSEKYSFRTLSLISQPINPYIVIE